MRRHRKLALLLSFILIAGLVLVQCVGVDEGNKDPRGAAYVGTDACISCHKDVYDLYSKTAHFHTSQPAGADNIQGSFVPGSNRFYYNDSTYIELQRRDSGFFQAAFINGKEVEAHRFDILFGGRHAQTSAFWKGERTFELPLSYYRSVNGWGTSPGFSASHIYFSRFVGSGCFECHSSYIGSTFKGTARGTEEVLNRNTLIYGIDCERCHGPAKAHIEFHEDHPNEKEGKYMTRIASLSREQKLDACAVCHSGNNKIREKSTFGFRPGDTLAKYFMAWGGTSGNQKFDVHGNQLQHLVQSPCFMKSKTLDCTTCHNPHENASSDPTAYSAVCGACHKDVAHSFAKDQQAQLELRNNCIDCHMPRQASQAITFEVPGSKEKSAYQLRTHRIGIYLDSLQMN